MYKRHNATLAKIVFSKYNFTILQSCVSGCSNLWDCPMKLFALKLPLMSGIGPPKPLLLEAYRPVW